MQKGRRELFGVMDMFHSLTVVVVVVTCVFIFVKLINYPLKGDFYYV